MSLKSLQAAISSKGGKKRRSFKSKKERKREEKKRHKIAEPSDTATSVAGAYPSTTSNNVAAAAADVDGVKGSTLTGDKVSSSPVMSAQGAAQSSVMDVKRALRERGEPVTLFGETNALRAARLRQVEESQPEQHHPGQTNVFQQILEKLEAAQQGNQGGEEEAAGADDPDLVALRDLCPERSDGREDDVMIYLMSLIELWRVSTESMRERARYKQTLIYILPLFERLASRRLGEEQLISLESIITALKQQNFAQAEDDYLMLAIGNSPWPLGVTSVGIHARSAREKISVGATAHVLNDETQRKYIQSVKRLMTWKQQRAERKN